LAFAYSKILPVMIRFYDFAVENVRKLSKFWSFDPGPGASYSEIETSGRAFDVFILVE